MTKGEIPLITEVVRRSGHKTLRVIFGEHAADDQVQQVLRKLNAAKACHEHAHGRFYAVDVEPDGDYPAVCDYLWRLEQQGLLQYETGASSQDQA